MMKRLILGLLLLMLAVPFVSADLSADYDITDVYVNGLKVTEDSLVQVEKGSVAQIVVFVEGTGQTEDVKVRTWMGGYEYGSIEEFSEVFKVQDGVMYKKTLYLTIPKDLNVEDNVYTLHVEVHDAHNRETKEYSLFFEAKRHNVIVKDVLMSSSNVEPGDYLGIKVRLDNQGDRDEDDLAVTVSIPGLGISNRVYLDELEIGDEDETRTVYLTIPNNAQSKTYELRVDVSYDNDNSQSQDVSYLTVDGDGMTDSDAIVSIQTVKGLQVGKENEFKVQVSNFGERSKTFYLEVEGMNAEYGNSILVPGGSSGEFVFTLNPENSGLQTVTVAVSSDEGIVGQKLFNVDVEKKSSSWVPLSIGLVILLAAVSLVLVHKK